MDNKFVLKCICPESTLVWILMYERGLTLKSCTQFWVALPTMGKISFLYFPPLLEYMSNLCDIFVGHRFNSNLEVNPVLSGVAHWTETFPLVDEIPTTETVPTWFFSLSFLYCHILVNSYTYQNQTSSSEMHLLWVVFTLTRHHKAAFLLFMFTAIQSSFAT